MSRFIIAVLQMSLSYNCLVGAEALSRVSIAEVVTINGKPASVYSPASCTILSSPTFVFPNNGDIPAWGVQNNTPLRLKFNSQAVAAQAHDGIEISFVVTGQEQQCSVEIRERVDGDKSEVKFLKVPANAKNEVFQIKIKPEQLATIGYIKLAIRNAQASPYIKKVKSIWKQNLPETTLRNRFGNEVDLRLDAPRIGTVTKKGAPILIAWSVGRSPDTTFLQFIARTNDGTSYFIPGATCVPFNFPYGNGTRGRLMWYHHDDDHPEVSIEAQLYDQILRDVSFHGDMTLGVGLSPQGNAYLSIADGSQPVFTRLSENGAVMESIRLKPVKGIGTEQLAVISSDNRWVVIGTRGKEQEPFEDGGTAEWTKVFDLKGADAKNELSPYRSIAGSLVPLPDSKYGILINSPKSKSVNLHEIEQSDGNGKNEEIVSFDNVTALHPTAVAVSRDGQFFAVGTIKDVDKETGKLHGNDGSGKHEYRHQTVVYSLASRREVIRLPDSLYEPIMFRFSPDSRRLVCIQREFQQHSYLPHGEGNIDRFNRRLQLWDVTTGTKIGGDLVSDREKFEYLESAEFANSGDSLITTTLYRKDDGTPIEGTKMQLSSWSLKNPNSFREPEWRREDKYGRSARVARHVSPDGRYLVGISEKGGSLKVELMPSFGNGFRTEDKSTDLIVD